MFPGTREKIRNALKAMIGPAPRSILLSICQSQHKIYSTPVFVLRQKKKLIKYFDEDGLKINKNSQAKAEKESKKFWSFRVYAKLRDLWKFETS